MLMCECMCMCTRLLVQNQITSAEGQGPFEPAAETIQPYHYPTVTHTDPYNGGRVNPYNQYTRPCDSGEPCQSWGMRGNADGLLSAKNGGLETLMGSASSPGNKMCMCLDILDAVSSEICSHVCDTHRSLYRHAHRT